MNVLTPFQKVLEFHKKFDLHIGNGELKEIEFNLGMKLIMEEYRELIDAFIKDDLVELTDAVIDLIFVLYGVLVRMGVDGDYLFDVVWEANMKKEGGAKRADGKLLKPEGWIAPQSKIEAYLKSVGLLDTKNQ